MLGLELLIISELLITSEQAELSQGKMDHLFFNVTLFITVIYLFALCFVGIYILVVEFEEGGI